MFSFSNNYTFDCSTINTSKGFDHIVKLYWNSSLISQNRVNYKKETYEQYEYQIAMACCVYKIIKKRKEELKQYYKKLKNITRLSKKQKQDLILFEKHDTILSAYKNLYKEIFNKKENKND